MATNKETILDLQTCKIIDSVVKNNEDVIVMLAIKL